MTVSEIRSKMLLLENDSNYFSFITSLMLSLPMKESRDVPTACATYDGLKFNPDFLDTMSEMEAVGLMCHEVLHVVLEHLDRREHRDPKKHNEACDAVINEIILEELKLPLPESPITFDELGVTDKTLSSEEVYELIKGKPTPDCEVFDLDPSLSGIPTNGSGGEEADLISALPSGSELETLITQSAILSGFDWGDAPNSELTRLIRELTDPKIPWETELLSYLFDLTISAEESWDRFDDRFFTLPLLMPGMTEEPTLTANCYVDISGSLTDDQVASILSEIKGISTSLPSNKLNVITWNTQIVEEFDKVENVEELEIKGSGGTDIQCVFQHIKKTNPKLTIIFTDGYFQKADQPEGYEFIWVIQDGELHHPYKGKVIKLEE